MIRKTLLILLAAVCASSICLAQIDVHLVDSPGKVLFTHSSWSHGYLHGYESGFHQGNIDLHMSREIRNPHAVKEYKQSGHSYRSHFGSREEFESGFGAGFEVGYLDAASGREFRAASEVIRTSTDISSTPLADSIVSDRYFDLVLENGYMAGRRKGLNDGRAKSSFDESEATCPQDPKMLDFCSAYKSGFRWGYSDGYMNQRIDSRTQRASR
jgi:hypothetical protein